MTHKQSFLAVSLSVLIASISLAQPLASDSFESAEPGSIDKVQSGQGFGDWHARDTGVTQLTIVEKSLSYEAGDIKIEGGSKALQFTAKNKGIAVIADRSISDLPDTFYLSYLVQADGSKDTNDFFQIGLSASPQAPQASAILYGTTCRVRSGTDSANNPNMLKVTQGQTLFIILKVSKSKTDGVYDSVTMYANPTSTDEAANKSVTHKASTKTKAFTKFQIRKAFTEAGDVYYVDAIKIGKTFESVIK